MFLNNFALYLVLQNLASFYFERVLMLEVLTTFSQLEPINYGPQATTENTFWFRSLKSLIPIECITKPERVMC